MARRRPKTFADIKPRGRGKNRSISAADKAAKLAAQAALPRQPFVIPVTMLYAWIAWLFLLPACLITLRTLATTLGGSLGDSFWRSAPFWFFAIGLGMWLICFFFAPRPVKLYVWGHEMTHALFTILCRGKVKEFRVTAAGGHVITDRNNVLIALSPYFVPLYTVCGVCLFLLAGLLVDLTRRIALPWGGSLQPACLLYWFIGVTWCFHITFTVWMIARDQPDLRINGTFFSLTLIILANLGILAALLILASPTVSPGAFTARWGQYARETIESLWNAVRTVGGMRD
jgi:hypothetical protein